MGELQAITVQSKALDLISRTKGQLSQTDGQDLVGNSEEAGNAKEPGLPCLYEGVFCQGRRIEYVLLNHLSA